MKLTENAVQLKIIINEEAIIYQRPLYEAIVYAAKKYRISGVTVTRGIMSYGSNNLRESVKVFSLSPGHPIILEMVDIQERLHDFAEIASRLIDKAETTGFMTFSQIEVYRYDR